MMASTLLALIGLYLVAFVAAVPQGRIVGGKDAVEGQFPHQVSLRIEDEHICGGSIISKKHILTAAHCVGKWDQKGRYKKRKPYLFKVLAGTTNRLQGGIIYDVISIDVHESFKRELNDIALLKLAEALQFSSTIQAIALASAELPDQSPVIISGWGSLTTYGDLAQQLQWNVLSSISKDECDKEIGLPTDSLICLAHKRNNGACGGDSGGPATFNGELVGVAGFVTDFCGSKYPDGYSKVFYHLDWIKRKIDI